ncbi:hypothetical protein C0058_19510 [Pseudomonas sp. NC02]|nr:hypothetical protein C0058_19510 [Pseudomonas sp. NC02]
MLLIACIGVFPIHYQPNLREETFGQVRPSWAVIESRARQDRPARRKRQARPQYRDARHHVLLSVDERGIRNRARTGRHRNAASRFWARQRHRKNARYLAKYVPVIETGRRLSLEQVPTEGLRY